MQAILFMGVIGMYLSKIFIETKNRPLTIVRKVHHSALEKVGFHVARQGKHVVMTNGSRILTIPRHNPVNAFTMGGIVRDAGLTEEEFRKLL